MRRLGHNLAQLIVLLASAACDDSSSRVVEDEDAGIPTRTLDAAVCRSQCNPGVGCTERPIETFPAFDDSLLAFKGECRDSGIYPTVAIGSCAGGERVLYLTTGKSIKRQYFTAEGVFVSLVNGVDFSQPPCDGTTYWPTLPACAEGKVTEVICGSARAVGTPL